MNAESAFALTPAAIISEANVGTDFERALRDRRIDSLTIGGLATDICVRWTALEARRLGFEVKLATDATRGVDVEEGDIERALEEMQAAGVQCMTTAELLQGANPSACHESSM